MRAGTGAGVAPQRGLLRPAATGHRARRQRPARVGCASGAAAASTTVAAAVGSGGVAFSGWVPARLGSGVSESHEGCEICGCFSSARPTRLADLRWSARATTRPPRGCGASCPSGSTARWANCSAPRSKRTKTLDPNEPNHTPTQHRRCLFCCATSGQPGRSGCQITERQWKLSSCAAANVSAAARVRAVVVLPGSLCSNRLQFIICSF